MDIKDCVAVVTGGSSGLGEATVRSLVEQGAKISILDIAEEKGQKLSAELGGAVIFCNSDVTKEESVKVAIAKTMDAFGAIHVAVNCAGVVQGAKVLGEKGPMSMVNFNKVVQINLMGTINAIRLAAEKMVQNSPNENGEKGVVVNTASGAAFDGQIGQAAYSASKAAIVGMTLPIAREFAGYGIRVVTIAPGLFDTPMVEGLPAKVRDELIDKVLLFPKRMGKPSEFAQLVIQSIENPMLNGVTIRLDGAARMTVK